MRALPCMALSESQVVANTHLWARLYNTLTFSKSEIIRLTYRLCAVQPISICHYSGIGLRQLLVKGSV